MFIPLFGMGNFTGIIGSLDLLYIVHRLSTFQLYGIIVRWRKIRCIERTVGIYKGNILRRRCGNFAVRRRWGSKGWRERGTLVISLVRWIGSGWGKTSHHPAGTNLVKRRGVVTGDVGVVTGDGGGVERWYGIRLNCWLQNWRIEPYFAWLKIHSAYWLYLITARCKNVPCSKMPVRCILIVYLHSPGKDLHLMIIRVSRPSSAKFKPPATCKHHKSDDQRDHKEIEAIRFA